MLMFTYGMNTNLEHMAALCPTARSLGPAILPNHRLIFKRYCDIELYQGAQCSGVLWELDESNVSVFDEFEEYPTFYDKKMVEVWYNSERVMALVYFMTDGNKYQLPTDGYFQIVRSGYLSHGIDTTQLIYAVANTRHILSGVTESSI